MIKNLALEIKFLIGTINPAPAIEKEHVFTLKKEMLRLIEGDLTHLSRQDPTFLDGPKGKIDYYSPFAEAQINNKQQLLEKYLNKLMLLEAVLICIQQKKTQIMYPLYITG